MQHFDELFGNILDSITISTLACWYSGSAINSLLVVVLFVKVLNMKVFLNFLCLPCLKRTSLALDEGYSVLVRITVLGEH